MRAAASVLRKNAEDATPGPWYASPHGDVWGQAENPRVAEEVPSWNQGHIAVWTPEAAVALAELLEYEADMNDVFARLYEARPTSDNAVLCAPNAYVLKLAEELLRCSA